jgi:hypothetical protein
MASPAAAVQRFPLRPLKKSVKMSNLYMSISYLSSDYCTFSYRIIVYEGDGYKGRERCTEMGPRCDDPVRVTGSWVCAILGEGNK